MEWKRGPILGRGSSAVVSLATTAAAADGGCDLFAVKSADVSCSALLENEQCLLSQLCSPFVVKCFGSDVTCERGDGHVYNLFLEYVPGGTLSDLIRNHGGSLEEEAIQFYARQMLLGLDYLHLKGMAHCDVKGQNVLIAADGGLKIADFGCAKWAECGGGSATKFAGTPAYMAPEVARGEEQSFPADIWALGCTVIEMATGSNPWPEMKDPASALYRVAYSGDTPEVPDWFSGTGKDFVARCLMRDPRERWTAAELLLHPFFDSVGKKNTEFARKSPTSVMDQGFWDAVEVSDPSPNPTDFAMSPENSPAGRIMDLIGDEFSWNLNFPEWTDEGDWVTVRGDKLEEYCSTIDQQQIEETNQDNESLVDEEGVTQTSIAIEDSLLISYVNDEISVNDLISSFEVILCESWKDDDSVSTTEMVMNLFLIYSAQFSL
ncbi:PREDICTED: mitogen-activated protein kinase kinase kinase 2, partial [Erythranthe guttata]|uniref:mitogen-activated protein kinase kinase kinase 2 n=1 Tax=Erythranthe guttata TaxID=4155 RepID=UPI00064D881C